MNEYHFNVEAAQRYGVDESIFLHSLAFWIEKNQANKKNFYKGRYWTYNTQDAFVELFPFWSRRQIGRIIISCENQGAVLVDNFNEDKSDRTKWYSMTDEAQKIYLTKTVQCNSPNGEMVEPQGKAENTLTKAPAIVPNGATEPCDAIHQTVQCIKGTDAYTDNIPPKSPKGGRGGKELSREVKDLLNGYVGHDKALADAMVTLMEIRTEHKATNSVRAVKSLLDKLDRLSGGDRRQKLLIMEQSNATGKWLSVFPLREGGRGSPPQEEVEPVVI